MLLAFPASVSTLAKLHPRQVHFERTSFSVVLMSVVLDDLPPLQTVCAALLHAHLTLLNRNCSACFKVLFGHLLFLDRECETAGTLVAVPVLFPDFSQFWIIEVARSSFVVLFKAESAPDSRSVLLFVALANAYIELIWSLNFEVFVTSTLDFHSSVRLNHIVFLNKLSVVGHRVLEFLIKVRHERRI